MLTVTNRAELARECAALRRTYGKLALVPTMGALHAGHRALVEAAVASGAGVVASIFVNPLQFAASDDLSRYPRDEAADLAYLAEAGCHLVWLPSVSVMYPAGEATTIVVDGPAERWEGAHRPGHFRGVATVVAKLFRQVPAEVAYFGEKDWQQLQVVRRMAIDLELGTDVVGIPTVRDADGLALSSRNRFLTPDERIRASTLPAIIQQTVGEIQRGRGVKATIAEALAGLADAGFAVDYVALVGGRDLEPLSAPQPGARLIATARLGSVRLLDNWPGG